MSGPVLDVRRLGAQLGPRFGVMVDALTLGPGEILVLDAVSGAGKSTALGLVSGAIPPSPAPGRLHRICGLDIGPRVPRASYADPATMGIVLQTNVMVPYLTIDENVRLPLAIAGRPPDEDWLRHLTGALGLADLGSRKPSQVSVGQRQRATIARALSGRPRLLLLDEPVSALDPANTEQVEALIAVLAEEAGAAVLLASHQAARGAFASAPRADHRVTQEDGVTTSHFTASSEGLP